MNKNNKVYICSPFRPIGETEEAQAKSIKRHKILARYACRYAVANGYSPLCPHLPQDPRSPLRMNLDIANTGHQVPSLPGSRKKEILLDRKTGWRT